MVAGLSGVQTSLTLVVFTKMPFLIRKNPSCGFWPVQAVSKEFTTAVRSFMVDVILLNKVCGMIAKSLL